MDTNSHATDTRDTTRTSTRLAPPVEGPRGPKRLNAAWSSYTIRDGPGSSSSTASSLPSLLLRRAELGHHRVVDAVAHDLRVDTEPVFEAGVLGITLLQELLDFVPSGCQKSMSKV